MATPTPHLCSQVEDFCFGSALTRAFYDRGQRAAEANTNETNTSSTFRRRILTKFASQVGEYFFGSALTTAFYDSQNHIKYLPPVNESLSSTHFCFQRPRGYKTLRN